MQPALRQGTLVGALDELDRLQRLVDVADLDADVHELGPEGVARLPLVESTMKNGVASLRRLLRLQIVMSSQHGFPFGFIQRNALFLDGRCR